MKGQGKREIPEKTRRPTASSGTIPTCRGNEPVSPWWEASELTARPPRPRYFPRYNQHNGKKASQFAVKSPIYTGAKRIEHVQTSVNEPSLLAGVRWCKTFYEREQAPLRTIAPFLMSRTAIGMYKWTRRHRNSAQDDFKRGLKQCASISAHSQPVTVKFQPQHLKFDGVLSFAAYVEYVFGCELGDTTTRIKCTIALYAQGSQLSCNVFFALRTYKTLSCEGRPPVAQSVGEPPIWGVGGSGIQSRAWPGVARGAPCAAERCLVAATGNEFSLAHSGTFNTPLRYSRRLFNLSRCPVSRLVCRLSGVQKALSSKSDFEITTESRN
ncbi:hypothetical protein PR048_015792 [Dryococelus australis]|uniref:Uncharacterized protein n=1 Tax=Dryococelus australis TaxID=614101 RepID=A0ABQ9HHY0_9NEOP|nr:hypothetical protein PR048_015792 [Dryococelus australis]